MTYKRRFLKVFTLLLSLSSISVTSASPKKIGSVTGPDIESLEIFFSPLGGCESAIIQKISLAKKTILIQCYTLTSNKIFNSLKEAHLRGVAIKIISDKYISSCNGSKLDDIINAQIEIKLKKTKGLYHHKTIIIDDYLVVTGSYNFTKAAEEKNYENLLVIKSRKVASIYTERFNLEWASQA